jgi:hypothetical protein
MSSLAGCRSGQAVRKVGFSRTVSLSAAAAPHAHVDSLWTHVTLSLGLLVPRSFSGGSLFVSQALVFFPQRCSLFCFFEGFSFRFAVEFDFTLFSRLGAI